MTQGQYCSQLSLTSGEQIYGTAGNATDVWFVLEYPAVWGAKAMEESKLDDALKAHLAQAVADTPGARLQLIKRGESRNGSATSFFIGLSQEDVAALYRFELQDFTDLAAMDLPAMVTEMRTDPARYAAHKHDEPLFLVCTNGSRDRCCATLGVPVYLTMAAYAGDQVWQTTHTGGHRFAATMIVLPHGLYYGRLSAEDALPIVDTYNAGDVYALDHYRGRSCYKAPSRPPNTTCAPKPTSSRSTPFPSSKPATKTMSGPAASAPTATTSSTSSSSSPKSRSSPTH